MFNLTVIRIMAAVALIVGGGTSLLQAEEKMDRTEALGAKLALSAEQKTEIRKLCAEHEKKMDPIEHQMWTAHQEARAELTKILTDEQKAKLPALMKEACATEFMSIANKLGLSAEQKTKLGKTVADFHVKFEELATQQPDVAHPKCRELKHEFMAAVNKDLTDDQRIRLPQVIGTEFKQWMNLSFQKLHVKAIEDQLAMTDDQKAQAEKILARCDARIKKPASEIKELCQAEHAAVEKVLSKEQADQLSVIMKTPIANEK